MNVHLLSLALAAMSIFLAICEQELSWKQWWDELPGDDAISTFPNEYVRDDIKQTNTVVVFLLLLSIIFRYYKCSAPLPFTQSYYYVILPFTQ